MSIIIATPTIAAPATIITLPDVAQLASDPTRVRQVQFETDSGGLVVYDFGGQKAVRTVILYPLTATHVAAIKDFYLLPIGAGGVNGMAGIWQLKDSKGLIDNVRFAMDVIEPQQRTIGSFELALTVRRV